MQVSMTFNLLSDTNSDIIPVFRILLCAARRPYADTYGMYAAAQIVISIFEARNLRTYVLRNGTTVERLEENK